MDRSHVWFIFVFFTQSWVWQKVSKYLLSERTNFWRKGKRAFQALKTKDPAPRCNWATGQRWICPGTDWRSKECFIPKKHWSQTIQSEVKSASFCLLQVKHAFLSRAKSGRHFKQISHAASGCKQPSKLQPWEDSCISCAWKIRSLIPRGYSKLLTRPVCLAVHSLKACVGSKYSCILNHLHPTTN